MTSVYVVARRPGYDSELSAKLCLAIKQSDLVHDIAAALVQQPTSAMRTNRRLFHYCAVSVNVHLSTQDTPEDLCPHVCEMLRSCEELGLMPRFWSPEDVAREFRADKDFASLKATLGVSVPISDVVAHREEDPLDIPAEPAAHIVRPERTQAFDRLLAWLTAAGRGRFLKLADACRALGLGEAPDEIRSVRRRLVLLGHMSVGDDGADWAIRKARAVALPGQPGRLFLCGQRVPALVARLVRDTGAEAFAQPGSDGPSRIVMDDSPEARAILGESIAGIQVCAVTQPRPLDDAPDASAWRDSQRRIEPPAPNGCCIEAFDGRAYQPVTGAVFDPSGRVVLPTGLYRVGATDERAGIPCLYDAADDRWLTGDWYGLRFMARRLAELEPPRAVFDPRASCLSVPRGWEWPLAHERALVLSTGLLPLVTSDVRQYEGVSRDVVAPLCERLGITLVEHEPTGEQACATY